MDRPGGDPRRVRGADRRAAGQQARQARVRADHAARPGPTVARREAGLDRWSGPIAVLVGIDLLGIDLTALAVFSGAFGLAIGFGLQKTFGNLIAGIILLMDRSIKPGDVIAVNDGKHPDHRSGQEDRHPRGFGDHPRQEGVPDSQRDPDDHPGRELVVFQPRTCASRSRWAWPTTADLDLAERLMLEAAVASPRDSGTAPAPTVWLSAFGDSSVDFAIQCWIIDPEEGLGNVRSDVLKRVWRACSRPKASRSRSPSATSTCVVCRGMGRQTPRDCECHRQG